MEEAHHTHKETPWGWAEILKDWRRSRTRQRLRSPSRILTPATR